MSRILIAEDEPHIIRFLIKDSRRRATPRPAPRTGNWHSSSPGPVDSMVLAQDGRGGLWLRAIDSSNRSWILHRSRSGNWRREAISGGAMEAPVLIPGTTSLWGVGGVRGSTGSPAAI